MDAGYDQNFNTGDHLHRVYSPAMSGEKRTIVKEMDFFSDHNQYNQRKTLRIDVNKDSAYDHQRYEIDTGLNLLTTPTDSNKSMIEEEKSPYNVKEKRSQSNKIVVLQAEVKRMITENQRLRSMLNRVNNNYYSLQMHIASMKNKTDEEKQLCYGYNNENNTGQRFGSPEVSYDQEWLPNKAPKLDTSGDNSEPNKAKNASAAMRRVRVSVRARPEAEAAMVSDGCQWKKYGQKMAKGNPCPRAYYRCTMAVGNCPVRKQVQRCAEDRTILTTTYEGNHNHPLPPAAMPMVSTTSAAASMLLAGSISTSDHHGGLLNSAPYNYSSPKIATISAWSPFPTITLDLTNSPQGQFGPIPFSNQQLPQNLPFSLRNMESKFCGIQSSRETMTAVAAAAAMITADPNLTAALVTAITSLMGQIQ